MTSRLARSTRSRSRSRVVPAEEVPAAASSNGTSANGTNGTDSLTKSSLHPNGNGVSIVSNGGSTTVPPLPPVEPTQRDEQGRSMRTNHYIEKITGSTNKYYWCQGEPDLRKVSVQLDTLTASDLALRGASSQLSQSVTRLNDNMQTLLDMNARLKRELREQKLSSNRRWIWAVLLLIAFTFGQTFVRTSLETIAWALNSPAEFFPALLASMHVCATWLFVLSFPLGLLLFIHKLLNSYGLGLLSLGRTIVSLVVGIIMQVPLLYFLMQVGLVFLAELKTTPIFQRQEFNHIVTIGIWMAMVLLDYVLIVLHSYVR